MAADTAVAPTPEETLESLLREAEALKQKLEEERQKLNDVTREYLASVFRSVNVPGQNNYEFSFPILFTVLCVVTKNCKATFTVGCYTRLLLHYSFYVAFIIIPLE